ncbi:GNAT family N-acetyltransferase [Caldicellulosiruptoraceae bacterium PP1]
MIRKATKKDLEKVALIFRESFPESINFYFNNTIKNNAIEDIFRIVLLSEPDGFLVYQIDNQVVGYICVITNIKRIWTNTIITFSFLKWAFKWFLGLYGFGLFPIKKIASNKLDFYKFQKINATDVTAQILSIGILKDYRGKSIGSSLVEAGLNVLKEKGVKAVKLEVRPDNISAIKLYKKFGFYHIGMSSDPQGRWIVMRKDFTE